MNNVMLPLDPFTMAVTTQGHDPGNCWCPMSTLPDFSPATSEQNQRVASEQSDGCWDPEDSSDLSLNLSMDSTGSSLNGLDFPEQYALGNEDGYRSVRFSPNTEARRIPNLQDMEEGGLMKSVWYSRHELENIRKECYYTIRLLSAGKYLGDDERGYSARGLEYKVPAKYKERQRIKSGLWQAIFEEQYIQRKIPSEDSALLATISREKSEISVQEALIRGLKDEHAAGECYATK